LDGLTTLQKRSRPAARPRPASRLTKSVLTNRSISSNITLYWLTNTAVSSARLYWESKLVFFAPKGITIPVAVSAFPDELYQAHRSWTEKAYPKLIHYNRLPKGTHFAAW